MRQTHSEHVAGLRYGPTNRGRRAGGPGGRGQCAILFEQLGRRLHARRAGRPCCRRPGEWGQCTLSGRRPRVCLAPPKRPMRSSVICGTLRFVCRTVEVVVASSSHGIEELAPQPNCPNKPAAASLDASAGISGGMAYSSPWLTQAACPQCRVIRAATYSRALR